MRDSITWVGLDVHKESIAAAAVKGPLGAVVTRLEVPNTEKGLQRLVLRMKELGNPQCAYEAGPCGYDVRRFLGSRDIPCDVVAPSLIPKKAGDRVKTDRRDAENLARMYRMGELTPIHVPTPAQEALRDLVRSREDAKEDLLRRRHRLQKFLLRQGRRYEGRSWTISHWQWVRSQRFSDRNTESVFQEYIVALEQEQDRITRLDARIEDESHDPEIAPMVLRLRALRGVDTVTAMTLVSELIDMKRFVSPRELMAFVGLVPRERSSGGKEWRGRITKTGNAHVRRVLVEAAWHYRHVPARGGKAIHKRREGQSAQVVDTAKKAEMRLHKKFQKMFLRGKSPGTTVVAVARELVGFVWALGQSH